MNIHKLEKLEHLLKEYLAETEGVLGIEKIKPCLSMVQEQIALYSEDYLSQHEDAYVDAYNENQLNALENQSPEQ